VIQEKSQSDRSNGSGDLSLTEKDKTMLEEGLGHIVAEEEIIKRSGLENDEVVNKALRDEVYKEPMESEKNRRQWLEQKRFRMQIAANASRNLAQALRDADVYFEKKRHENLIVAIDAWTRKFEEIRDKTSNSIHEIEKEIDIPGM